MSTSFIPPPVFLSPFTIVPSGSPYTCYLFHVQHSSAELSRTSYHSPPAILSLKPSSISSIHHSVIQLSSCLPFISGPIIASFRSSTYILSFFYYLLVHHSFLNAPAIHSFMPHYIIQSYMYPSSVPICTTSLIP